MRNKINNRNYTGGGELFNVFKFAAVGSAGAMLGMIPQLLIGTLILILGIYLVTKQRKQDVGGDNNKHYDHDFEFYLGIGLIIIGSVVSLNLFLGVEFITGLFDSS